MRASRETGPARGPHRVTFLTRQGCHLCEVARGIVLDVAREADADVAEVDVDGDAGLRARWGDLVPVVLIDGVEHARWRVNRRLLRQALGG